MEESLSFGYWVRRRRKALDLTQAQLGACAGASAAMIRKIEADERRPSRELAEMLAECLAVPAGEREAFLRAARDVAAVEDLAPTAGPVPNSQAAGVLPFNLPAPVTSMVNRVHDLSVVSGLLARDDVRLVTLLGPPGIGKTRLSIQVGQQVLPQFADGVWFVDLAPLNDRALLLPAIAAALGLPAVADMPISVQVQAALRERQLLLILDNMEQLVDGAAADVAALLRVAKGLKVLATSRIRLDIYGEHEYLLPPMSYPAAVEDVGPDEVAGYEAVQLFVARVRQHQPDFALTAETAGSVVEICQRMDGLPLALELAAARARRMPVGQLAAALREASGRDWHALLYTGARDLPPRQQTLFNAIGWSYSLLEPALQSMLCQLSIFAGPFDWPAVDAVVDDPSLAGPLARRDAFDHLANHNLVARNPVDYNLVSQAAESLARWRLLEMIREFARGLLPAEARRAAARRHADHYARLVTSLLDPEFALTYEAEVEAILEDARAALQWALDEGEATLAHRLAAALEWYWERRGLLEEGRRYLEQTLALPGEVDDDLRLAVLHAAANQAWMQHDLATAHRHTAAALALARNRGESARIPDFLNLLARIYLEEGNYEEADRALIEGIHLEKRLPRGMSPTFMLIQRGEAALGIGDLEQAEALLREGLVGTDDNDLIPYCVGWTDLAEVALARRDAFLARAALLRVLPLAHLHARRTRLFFLALAGYLSLDPDGAANAVALLGLVSAANRRFGDPLSKWAQALLVARAESARERLSPEEWQAAWEDGEQMGVEDALQLARTYLGSE